MQLGAPTRSQGVLRAGRRRLLTYDSRMSESMRLANEYKADRVDQFYAALHESAFGTKRTWRDVRVMSAIGGKADIVARLH